MKRSDQTEQIYRIVMREKLVELLKVLNPQDQITFGAMPYPDLVAYARDWIETEVQEVNPKMATQLSSLAQPGPGALPL